jgi:hypothetical protein
MSSSTCIVSHDGMESKAAMFHDGGREALTHSVIIAGMALNRETTKLARAANLHAEVVQESNFTSTEPGTNWAGLQTFAIDWTCLLSPPHPIVKHSSLCEIHTEIQLDLIPTALLAFPRMHR